MGKKFVTQSTKHNRPGASHPAWSPKMDLEAIVPSFEVQVLKIWRSFKLREYKGWSIRKRQTNRLYWYGVNAHVYRPVFKQNPIFRGSMTIKYVVTCAETVCRMLKLIFHFVFITFFEKFTKKILFPPSINQSCTTTWGKCNFFESWLLWGEICNFLQK